MTKAFLELFRESVARNPGKSALIHSGKGLVYRELESRANAIAGRLKDNGLEKGGIVPVSLERNMNAVAALLGVWKAGGAACMVNADYPEERLRYIVRECKARQVIDADWLGSVDFSQNDFPVLPVDPTDTALVVFTSGSTGEPKGVVIPQRAVSLAVAGNILGRTENDVFLSLASFSFIAITVDLLVPLSLGSTVHIADQNLRQDVAALARHVQDNGVTTALIPPQTAAQFLRLADGVLSCILVGTERVSGLYSAKTRIVDTYGASETCGPFTSFTIDKLYDNTPIGVPAAGSGVFILDDAGRQAPQGTVGEICVYGQIADGYLNSPELTAERFVPNPYAAGPEDSRLFRTNDLGRVLPDGNLEYVNRKDWMLKIRGHRVEPGEIEAAMTNRAPIDRAVVVGFENAAGATSLYACYTAGESVSPETVKEAIAGFLPDYMLPAFMEQVDAFPLNANGKIDRKNIAPPDLARYKAAYVAPANEIETALCAAFSQVLKVGAVGANDDFTLLGGDSVAAVRLQAAVPGLGLSVADILRLKTPANLAASISEKPSAGNLPRADARNDWPLSFAERQMAAEAGIDPDSVAYNVNVAFDLSGSLDAERLGRALDLLVRRTRILRSYYPLENGDIVHRIAPVMPAKLDRETCAPEQADRRIDELNAPFDLAHGPLYRFTLFSCGDKWVLNLCFHHIIIDGVSGGVLLDSLLDLYEKGATAEEIADKPDYLDYAVWQAEQDGNDPGLAYFLDMFSDGVPENEMPTRPIRPDILPFADEEVICRLDGARLADTARRRGVSVYSLLVAAAGLTLAKYVGNNDVVLGLAMNGRELPEAADMIGMFVNTVPLRVKTPAESDLDGFLDTIHQRLETTREHQACPLEKLVPRLAPDRNSSRSPLYDVIVNYLEEMPTQERDGLSIARHRRKGQALAIDLQLEMVRDGDAVYATLSYSPKLYQKEIAEGILEQFHCILDRICANRNMPLPDAAELPEAMRDEIVHAFMGAKHPEPTKTAVDLFRDRVSAAPRSAAAVYEEEALTYAGLDAVSDRLAVLLAGKGIGPGKTVGVLVRRGLMMPIGAYGVLKTGAAYVPLDPSYPPERLQFMLSDSAASVVVGDAELRELLPDYAGEYIASDAVRGLTGTPAPDELPAGPGLDDLFVLLYTSGTTGNPKGVMLTHANLAVFLDFFRDKFKLAPGDSTGAFASFGFDANLMDMHAPLTSGACVHIISDEMRLDLPAVNRYFDENGIRCVFMTTQLGRQFAESMDNHSLRTLITGGESLVPLEPPKHFTLFNGYGPTECTVFVCEQAVDRLYERVPLGRAHDNVAFYILDKNGRLAPVGTAGELTIAGPQVARGYLNRPDLTEEKFVPNPFLDDPRYSRMYCTGDVVRWLPGGVVDFIGRSDFQVKIRGFRVELTEIEGRIRQYPGITDAAVIARDAPAGGKCAVAYIVSETPVDIASLHVFIEETLPPYMVPAATMQVEKIPLNPNGKVDRRKLPEPVYGAAPGKDESGPAPQSELEVILSEAAGEILGHRDFGMNTDLFGVGLTSLSAVKLCAKIDDRFGVSPTVRDIMREPNLLGIENVIIKKLVALAKNPPESALGKTVVTGAVPTSFPLSQSQLGVCFDCLKRPATLAYNIPLRVDFSRAIDPGKLETAVKAVIDAHPAVKSHLLMDGDRIEQVPGDSPAVVERIDAEEAELAEFGRRFVKPFDLFAGPLYRAAIVHTPERTALFVDFHHVVFDGGSLDIFMRQLGAAYERGALPSADMEKISGFEWARQEEEREGSADWEADREYFEKSLADFEGASEIPPDLPHRDEPGRMAEAAGAVDRERVETFCRANGVTPAGLFLGALSYAVSRWVQTRDVYMSTISSGRSNPGLRNSFGMFVRTLPLALKIGTGAETTVLEYLKQTQMTLAETVEHEGYPFTRIAQAYSYEPAIMYACELGVTGNYRVDGEKAALVPLAANETKFKLSVHIEERDGGFVIAAQYDDALYSARQMRRFVDSMRTALYRMMDEPAAFVRSISLVSPEQLIKLDSFNQTDAPLPEPVLHRMFEKAAAANPERTALVAQEATYTYSQLDAAANRLANALVKRGVGREDKVAFLLGRTGRVLISMLGILKSGGAYIPVDPEYPAERIRHVLDDSGSRFILTTADRMHEFDNALDIDVLLAEGNPDNPGVPVTGDQLAYMIYTSGSTGKPKGVMLEHRGISNYVTSHPLNKHVYGLVQNATAMLSITTVAFDMFLKESMTSLANGVTLVFADDAQAYDPGAMSELFEKTGADAFNTTPSRMLEYMQEPGFLAALRKCKIIMAGAEKYPDALLAKLREGGGTGARLYNTYGPTEITVSANAKELTDSDRVTIGSPLLGVHEYVVDLDGNRLPIGMTGELWVGGRGVARGYVNLPEQTAEKFVEYNGERVYKTGDLARWTEDGEIELLGRNDTQVKLRGLRIELGEIESALRKIPGVKTGAVTIRKINNGDHLAAYYVADEELDPRAVREELVKGLAPYMVPTAYLQLAAMPKTPNGKDDIRSLPEPELLRINSYEAPATALEKSFCDIFAKVLELDSVGANDSFFDIGGTSLAVTRVIIEAKDRGVKGVGGATLVYGDVFANPTPRELAGLLAKSDGESAQPSVDESGYDYGTIDALLAEGTLDEFRTGPRRKLGNVLLTGATGFLGAHVLKALLEHDGNSVVYCLLRKGSHADAAGRLKNILYYYFEDTFEDHMGGRIIPVDGDITSPRALASLLSRPLDSIINCAANVSHFSKGTEIYDVNTAGVLNIIDFAKQKNARLIQVSTASVAGLSVGGHPPRDFKMDETMLFFGQNLENQYVHSKFLAERAILEAAKSGLDAKIMRVGNLMARNRDGEFQVNSRANSFLGRLRAYHTIGCFPYSSYHSQTELAPIDSTAQSILLLSEASEKCRVFHPYNNHYLFMGDIIGAMRDVGIPIAMVEDKDFEEALSEAMRDKARAVNLTSLIAYQNIAQGKAAVPVATKNEYTSQALYRCDWHWPETSGEYLRKFLEGLAGLGFFD